MGPSQITRKRKPINSYREEDSSSSKDSESSPPRKRGSSPEKSKSVVTVTSQKKRGRSPSKSKSVATVTSQKKRGRSPDKSKSVGTVTSQKKRGRYPDKSKSVGTVTSQKKRRRPPRKSKSVATVTSKSDAESESDVKSNPAVMPKNVYVYHRPKKHNKKVRYYVHESATTKERYNYVLREYLRPRVKSTTCQLNIRELVSLDFNNRSGYGIAECRLHNCLLKKAHEHFLNRNWPALARVFLELCGETYRRNQNKRCLYQYGLALVQFHPKISGNDKMLINFVENILGVCNSDLIPEIFI